MENFTRWRTFAQYPFNGILPKGRLHVRNLPIGYWNLDFTSTRILWTDLESMLEHLEARAVQPWNSEPYVSSKVNLIIYLVVSSQIGLVHHTVVNGEMTLQLFVEFVTKVFSISANRNAFSFCTQKCLWANVGSLFKQENSFLFIHIFLTGGVLTS